LRYVRLRKALLLGGPVSCGGKNVPSVRTVADLPTQERIVTENMVAGFTTEQCAASMHIVPSSVYAALARARQRVGVDSTKALIRWAKRGGQCRVPGLPDPYPVITVRAADGATMVDVMVYSCLNELAERYPGKLQKAYSDLRDKLARDRERARKSTQDALGSIAGLREDVQVREIPADAQRGEAGGASAGDAR
jgi:DNA-binding CsgD family transcriptional regulator